MYDTAKRSMVFAVATGGLLLAGAAQASAETTTPGAVPGGGPSAMQASTTLGTLENADAAPFVGSGGVLSHNSIDIPLTLPLNLCGNGIAVLGTAMAGGDCATMTMGSAPTVASASAAVPSRGGLLSSNSVLAPIDIPVNACGDAVAVAGHADTTSGSTCTVDESGSASSSSAAMGSAAAGAAWLPMRALGGVLSSNTVRLPVAAPVNACGDAVAVLGHSDAAATCAVAGPAAGSAAGSAQSIAMPAPQIRPQVSEAQQPQAVAVPAAAQIDKPVVAHPVVMWPRPELAAMAIPAADVHPALADALSQDPPGTSLAQTGAETVLPAGVAAAALAGGLSLRAVGQHRRRSRSRV